MNGCGTKISIYKIFYKASVKGNIYLLGFEGNKDST